MHLPTLLIVNVALSVVSSITLASIANRRNSELYLWAVAIAMHALGYGLAGLRGQVSDFWSIVAGNAFFSLSLALLAEGVYRFQERRPQRLLLWLPVPLTFLLFIWFINDLGARLLWGGLLLAIQLVLVLWALLWKQGVKAGRGHYVIILGFLVALACVAWRMTLVLSGSVPSDLFDSDSLYNLIFFGNLLALLLITVGMIMMVQERTQQELLESEGRYRQLIESAQEGVCILYGIRCIYANSRSGELLGVPAPQMIGKSLIEFVEPDDRSLVLVYRRARQAGVASGKAYDIRIRTTHSGLRWFSVSSVQIQWQGRNATLIFLSDIHERKQMEERVRQLAYHDELTKLPNRRLFVDRFRQVLNLHRHIGGHVALMFIDLDKFKALNDQYGHKAGDQLLIEVARRLRQVGRESDTVARFGGDEFVVLLQALDANRQVAQEQASSIAEKIRLAISTPYSLGGSDDESGGSFPYTLSASIGVHLFGDASVSVDELLDHADTAMYRAKKDGRGEVRFTEAGTA